MTREILIMQRAVGTAMTMQVMFNGALQVTAFTFATIVGSIAAVGVALYLIWKYWDDIVKAIGNAIQAFDRFLGLGSFDDQRKNAAEQLQAQKNIYSVQAPNSREAQQRAMGMNVNTNVNVNAPKDYEVKTKTETRPITGNMGYAH